MTLQALRNKKAEVQKEFSKLDAQAHSGTITKEERDNHLREKFGSHSEKQVMNVLDLQMVQYQDQDEFQHKMVYLVSGFSVAMIALFATLLYSTGGITGAVVMEVNTIDNLYTQSDFITVLLNDTTRINITGIARGAGNANLKLQHSSGTYDLYEYSLGLLETEHASIPKHMYYEGEIVQFNVSQESTNYLMTDSEAIPLGNQNVIENLTVGEYVIKVIINDSVLLQEELPFQVVPVNSSLPEAKFNNCGEACSVNLSGEAQILIELEGNATILIGEIVLISRGNTPPEQLVEILDITTEDSVVIDLNEIFTDVDGDQLLFESSHHALTEETIIDGVLTITGEPGTYGFIVYASDLVELVPSNSFAVTFLESDELNVTENLTTNISDNETETNNTQNQTANQTSNETINATSQNLTNATTNITLPVINQTNNSITDCNYPDVNKRPLECLQTESDKYFQDQIIRIPTLTGRL